MSAPRGSSSGTHATTTRRTDSRCALEQLTLRCGTSHRSITPHRLPASGTRFMEDAERAVLMRLLISCPDKPGIVSAVSRFLFESGANIVRSDQYSTDPQGGAFFLRMEFALDERRLGRLYEQFGLEVAEPFGMTWRIWNALKPKRVVVMVSRYDHCLLELLW